MRTDERIISKIPHYVQHNSYKTWEFIYDLLETNERLSKTIDYERRANERARTLIESAVPPLNLMQAVYEDDQIRRERQIVTTWPTTVYRTTVDLTALCRADERYVMRSLAESIGNYIAEKICTGDETRRSMSS